MAEETAKQLRCVILYFLTENRGNHSIDTDKMTNFFVSLKLAKAEAEKYRKSGVWFEINPFAPCFGFRFDSKWLLVHCGAYRCFHLENNGQTLCWSSGSSNELVKLKWKGKTLQQITDYFRSLDKDTPTTDIVFGINLGTWYSMYEIHEPTTIQEATCLSDVDLSSFTTLKSKSGTRPKKDISGGHLNWVKGCSYRTYSRHEEAKTIDRQLAKFFPN